MAYIKIRVKGIEKKHCFNTFVYIVTMVTGNKMDLMWVKNVSLNVQYVLAPYIFTG